MGVHPVVTPIAQSHVRPTEPTLASSSSQMESRDALTSCPSSEHSLLESLTSRLSPSQGSVEQVQAREGPRTECPLGHAGEGVGRARGQRGLAGRQPEGRTLGRAGADPTPLLPLLHSRTQLGAGAPTHPHPGAPERSQQRSSSRALPSPQGHGSGPAKEVLSAPRKSTSSLPYV